jgi:hypothetical protein
MRSPPQIPSCSARTAASKSQPGWMCAKPAARSACLWEMSRYAMNAKVPSVIATMSWMPRTIARLFKPPRASR